jgi:hypothetical protein
MSDFSFGQMDFPFEWQPRVVSTQLALIGTLAIVCVPGEFTTMSGRRLRAAVNESVTAVGGPPTSQVIVAGLCNTYSDYITTPEEYQVQVSLRFVTVTTLLPYYSFCIRLASALGVELRARVYEDSMTSSAQIYKSLPDKWMEKTTHLIMCMYICRVRR